MHVKLRSSLDGVGSGKHDAAGLAVISRRRLLAGLAGLGASVPLSALLAACGGDDDDGDVAATATSSPDVDADDPTATAPSESEEEEPTSGAEDDEEPTVAATEASDTDADAPPATPTPQAAEATPTADEAAATRDVVDAFGETVAIPANPERIVVFDRRGTLAYMLDLGIRPVGAMSAPTIYGGDGFHPLITGDTEGISAIPWPEPDLELVASLDPDLILGYPGDGLEDTYDTLKAMAPTVAIAIDFNNPQTELATLGEIFGLEDRAEALIAEFESALETARAEVADPGTVSILLALEDGVRVYTGENLIGQIVTGLGGSIVPDITELGPSTSEYFTLLSFEQVSSITGETFVAIVNLSEELRATHEAFLAHPLVELLPAVQTGRIVEAESQAVFGTAGLSGQYQILEQLTEAFADTAS